MGIPCLNKGEKIIAQTQGSLKFRFLWQIGHLFLTNRRLLFIHITKQTYETNLDEIVDLSIKKRAWLFGVRVKQLCISFNSSRGQERVYIALAKSEKWIEMIKESMTLMLAERCGYNGANPESPGNT